MEDNKARKQAEIAAEGAKARDARLSARKEAESERMIKSLQRENTAVFTQLNDAIAKQVELQNLNTELQTFNAKIAEEFEKLQTLNTHLADVARISAEMGVATHGANKDLMKEKGEYLAATKKYEETIEAKASIIVALMTENKDLLEQNKDLLEQNKDVIRMNQEFDRLRGTISELNVQIQDLRAELTEGGGRI